MNTEMWKDGLIKAFRMLLIIAGTFGFAWAQQLEATAAQTEQAIAGIAALIGVIWSWVNWFKAKKRTQ